MVKDKENKKTGSPVFILVIFSALILFLFVLPDIYHKYNKEIADLLGIGSNTNKPEKKEEPEIEEISDFYLIKENKAFNYNELKIKKIVLTEEGLKLEIETTESIDLEEKNYYIEFYEDKAKFLGRRILKNKINGSQTILIDTLNMDIDENTYIALSHVSDEAIPKKQLTTDESGLASIKCEKENKIYTYEFYLSDLTKVTYEEEIFSEETNSHQKFEHQKTTNKYNIIEGVTASIIDSENGYSFIAEFDYSTFKSNSAIKIEHLFNKDEKANILLYKMNAEGFDCK